MVPGNGVIEPLAVGDDPESCGVDAVEPVSCSPRFGVAGVESDVRTLRYQRGEESARWLLDGA